MIVGAGVERERERERESRLTQWDGRGRAAPGQRPRRACRALMGREKVEGSVASSVASSVATREIKVAGFRLTKSQARLGGYKSKQPTLRNETARVGLPSRWLPGEALGATAGASYACRGIGDCVRHHFTVSPTRPRVLMVHWPSTARWAIAGELCGSVDCSCSQHELAVSMGGRAEVIARAPGPGVDPSG